MARAQTYSAYKAANTVKSFTVIAPNGQLMFVSHAYGGRASNKHIVCTCGVEDYLQKGDEIMADQGFALEAHLEVRGIKMNVVAFTRSTVTRLFQKGCFLRWCLKYYERLITKSNKCVA